MKTTTKKNSGHPARGLGWARLLAVALLAAVTLPAGLTAQRGNRAELERQLRQRFEGMVQRELALDDDQRDALSAAIAEFQEPRQELSRRQRELQRRMRGTGALLDAEEASSVLEEFVAVKRQEVDLLAAEHERLREILSPPQLVRFYTLREQFANRVRRLRQNRPGGTPEGRSGGIEEGWRLFLQ